MLAEEGDKLLLIAAHKSIVVPLVDRRLDVAFSVADGEELTHLLGAVVAYPKLDISANTAAVLGLERPSRAQTSQAGIAYQMPLLVPPMVF